MTYKDNNVNENDEERKVEDLTESPIEHVQLLLGLVGEDFIGVGQEGCETLPKGLGLVSFLFPHKGFIFILKKLKSKRIHPPHLPYHDYQTNHHFSS